MSEKSSPPKPTREPRQIRVITRSNSTSKNFWERTEEKAKIFSLVAIPVVLAIGGWIIQQRLAENSYQQEYVKLAVSILIEPAEEKDEGLRSWAISILNRYSPFKLDLETKQALKSGDIRLPSPGPILSENYNRSEFATATLEFPNTPQESLQLGKSLLPAALHMTA